MESSWIVMFATNSMLYDARRTSLLRLCVSSSHASYYFRVANTTVIHIDEFGGIILGDLIGLIDMPICWSVRVSNENPRLFLTQLIFRKCFSFTWSEDYIFKVSYVCCNYYFVFSATIPLLSWFAAYARLWDGFFCLAWASNVFCFVSFMKITAYNDVIYWCLSSFTHK